MAAATSDVGCVHAERSERLDDGRKPDSASDSRQQSSERTAPEIRTLQLPSLTMTGPEWLLEDRIFKQLMPRAYREVARLVRRKRAEREQHTARSVALLEKALEDAGLAGSVHGRTKNLYSIHRKLMRYVTRGRGFDEIYDLTALRVVVGSVADCYSVLGVVHALWNPVPGEFDDFIADPKENLYQSLHTSVIGPEGQPLEVQIRTKEMHRVAEHGAAAHASYKRKAPPKGDSRPQEQPLARYAG